MNNKGFTLIELIVTIALLAIIAIISFVSINGVIEESKINDCENLLSSIRSAAKEYVSDNRYEGTFVNNVSINDGKKYSIITTEVLITNKYLSENIVNPFVKNEIIDPNDIKIRIELNKDFTVFKVDLFKIMTDGEKTLQCIQEEW